MLLPFFSSAQWERTNGPYGGSIGSMAFLSPYLYAASTSGLFRTTDNGINWSPVEGLPEYDIKGLAASNGKLFIIGKSYGMFVTNDHCESWDKAGVEIPVDPGSGTGFPVIQYIRLYSSPNYLYCITGIGTYRSSDNGNSWQLFLSTGIFDIIHDGDTILVCTTSPNQTIRTVDNGQNWSTVTGLTNMNVRLGKLNNTWVAQRNNATPGFLYSTNGGASFNTTGGYSASNITSIVSAGGKLFSGSAGVIKTTTDGINWNTITVPTIPPNTGGFYNCFSFGNDVWFSGSNKLLYSDDLGTTLNVRNKGITSLSGGTPQSGLYYNKNDNFLYTTYYVNSGIVHRSSDQGNNWYETGSGLPTNSVNSVVVTNFDSVYFAGTKNGLYRSEDSTASWSYDEIFRINHMIRGNTELYLADNSSGVHKSQDGGNTWIPVNSGMTNDIASRLIWNQNKLYAATSDSLGLCVSADSGSTWTSLSGPSFVIDFNILEDSIITYVTSQLEIIRSLDYGFTWDTLAHSTGFSSSHIGVVMNDSLIFLARNSAGIMMFNTATNEWSTINNGLTISTKYPRPECGELEIDSAYLYSNTRNLGIWRLPLDSIVLSGQLSGRIYWDQNSDGIKQAGEPYMNDESVKVDPFNITADTDASGYFQYTYTGSTPDYTIDFNPKPYWNVTSNPPSYQVTPLGSDVDSLDFGINMISNVTDVKVDLASGINRPGFNINYLVTVRNVGTNTLSDVVTVTLDNYLTYISGTTPQNVNLNTYTYAYNNLGPGQSQMFYIIAQLNPATPLTTVLNNSATVYPLSTDSVPINNIVDHHPIVFGSFDPNNKISEPSGNIAHQDLITYQVNFQNTGTDTAFTVIVRDTISPLLDLNTFTLVSHSHPVTVTIKNGNVLEFRFDQILLPDSNTNEPASHGMVRFSIKPVLGLSLNTTIYNEANISFDYNIPIITNNTTNTITGFTGAYNPGDLQELNVIFKPNPFKDLTTLEINSKELGPFTLSIYDCLGKLILKEIFNIAEKQIQKNYLEAGLYLYEVRTESGKLARGKLIVE